MRLTAAVLLAAGLLAGPATVVATTASTASTASHSTPTRPSARAALTAGQRIHQQIVAAVAAKTYPSLAPTLGSGDGVSPYLLAPYQCINPTTVLNTDQCNIGMPTGQLAVVMGDSVSTSILPAVRDVLRPRGWRIHGIALSACPVSWVRAKLNFDPEAATRCNNSHQLMAAQVQRLHPDLLILTDSASGMQRLESGNRHEDAVKEWHAGMVTALRALSAPGRRIIVLAPNPTAADPRTCAHPPTTPKDCLYTIDPWWFGKQRAERAAAQETGAQYVDTLPWYASGDQVPVFAGGTSMRWDHTHLTASYAHKLAPALEDVVFPGGS